MYLLIICVFTLKSNLISFVKIWIHTVWTTKNRQPFLNISIRENTFKHIHRNVLNKGILVDVVNGYSEHVHCLFRLKNDQTIKDILQLLKGESSFWINKQNLIKTKFKWQKEYYAVSVSESHIGKVFNYFQNQEEHHSTISFDQEFNKFIEKFGFKVFKDGE